MLELKSCDVCGEASLGASIDLGEHPLQDDLVSIGEARECEKHPTEVVFCNVCKTAHLRWQLPKKTLFQPGYTHRSHQTPDVLRGMTDLVSSVEKQYGSLADKRVLDIGCNDGSLLDEFRRHGAKTFGIEPTNAALEAQGKGHDVHQGFFDQKTASNMIERTGGKPDVITFTNVFAHIEEFQDILRAVKLLLKEDSILVVENHYLGAVLDKQQFDTFFHEHLRTYSYTSFLYIAKALGMHVDSVSFPERYGGNIRVFMRMGATQNVNQEYVNKEADFANRLLRMGVQIKQWKQRKRAEITRMTDIYGPIGAVALPARAPMLFTLLDLTPSQVACVWQIDGSAKIGNYVPGTRIPIVSDGIYDFSQSKPTDMLLNMAWHIPKDIETRWRSLGYKGKFVQIIDEGDFRNND